MTILDAPAELVDDGPRRVDAVLSTGDRIFRRGSGLTGFAVLAIMVAVGLFLSINAFQALKSTGVSFFTTAEWEPATGEFGIAAILAGTVTIAFVAVSLSVPLATGTALFVSEVAPHAIRRWCIAAIDLMAAVPSVVYGLWGLFFLQDKVIGLARFLSTWFSWIPIFDVSNADPASPLVDKTVYTASAFIAGIVVSMMVVPIQCSVMREAFSQAPAGEREGAFALGATRWGMIRSVVLPFGRGGIIGGTMLGLGRAMGETIAVLLIISPRFELSPNILEAGTNSVSAHIANRFNEESDFGLSALMAAGLTLFVLTLIINFTASAFVARSRSGALSEA